MTTFISYSRINSDFAVSIAKDLKLAGFDIWLDQIDIPTGSRWDDEIEKALDLSTTFLIVLSPESIQSQNVKDEIGYAIDAGKHILPVVIQNCKVPLRLRRFQYVDFTDDSYAQSLDQIKVLLRKSGEVLPFTNDGNIVVQKEIQTSGNNAPVKDVPVPNPSSVKEIPPTQSSFKLNPQIMYAIVGIVLIVLAIPFIGKFMKNEPIPAAKATAIFTALAQVSAAVPFTETSTPVPPSETPAPPTFTATPFPDELTDVKGVTMRFVPAGEFIMGNGSGEPDEQPVHNVYLSDYYIDKYEVTNKLYGDCVAQQVCDPPRQINSFKQTSYFGNPQFNDYPVIYVDWNMAKTYCEWRGAHLPTEAQWEKAARSMDGRSYPWGEGVECAKANYGGCGKDVTFIGGSQRGRSVYDVFDMAGNVWEWVSDWYSADYYQNSPAENPLGPNAGAMHVLRGGSWADLGSSARSANRHSVEPAMFGNSVGIRCAADVAP